MTTVPGSTDIFLKNTRDRNQWLMPVILAIQEAEVRRIVLSAQANSS
jgi:hypothetical protein